MKILVLLFLFSVNTHALSGRDIIKLHGKKFVTKVLSTKFQTPVAWRSNRIDEEDETNIAMAQPADSDLVFFSYGTKDKSNSALTNTNLKMPKISKQPVKISAIGANSKNTKKKYKPIIDFSSFIQSSAKKISSDSSFVIKLREIGLKGVSGSFVSDYDLVPSYNLNELFTDSGTGEIKIPIVDSDDYSTFRASVAARGIIRTNFELSVRSDTTFEIPIVTDDYLDHLLNSNKVKEETGAHILVSLGDKVDSSTFEGKYKDKVFLNKNFKQVEEGDAFEYELYMDVSLGNHLIKYMDFRGKTAEKIVHTVQDEITYESPLLLKEKSIGFSIYEENLASKKFASSNTQASEVRYFNQNLSPSRAGINRFKMLAPIRDASFRHYLEIGDESVVFVGFTNIDKIVLPSSEYIDYLKELLGNSASDGACVVQINLSKPITKFEASFTSIKPSGSYDFYYMDKDGTVSDEITGLTEKVFVISHDYGIMNSRIENGKNDIEYLQSFCTENLYIIENI